MISVSNYILIVGLISSSYLSSTEAMPAGPSSMAAAVKFVDDYLTERVKTDNVEENMEVAMQLLGSSNDRSDDESGSESDIEPGSEADIETDCTLEECVARVVGTLANIKAIFEEKDEKTSYFEEIFGFGTHCTDFSYFALATLNRYTNGGLEKEDPVGRVEMIGRHYAKRHAWECAADSESRLEGAMKNIHPTLMERVDAYLGVGISFVQPPHKYLLDGIVSDRRLKFILVPDAPQQAYDALVHVTRNSPNDSKLLHDPVQANQIKKLYWEYFVSACKDLYQEIAYAALPEIFDNEVVAHGDLPDIYKKFIECQARRVFDYSDLVKEIAKIAERS